MHVSALSGTDTITWGGDNTRAGYQANHNMDPKVVGSADFGQIFRTLLPGNFNGLAAEQIFSQPLVYTGADRVQYVYVATTQNNIYKLDAKTGAIVKSRNLHVPFLQAELESCVDINPLIGVTATGVIDPDTGIWYLTAKTYADQFQDGKFGPQNPPGRLNGRYWQHAIHTEDLSEAQNWPVLVDGTIFRNNPNRMFIGGNQHSRPGALLVGNYVFTGYASHCVQYNYTGAIIGFHKATGKIVEAFAMQGGPEANTVRGGGIWMSGGGLAYDGKGSMYFVTGNGYASQLKATGNSVLGRFPPTSLEEAAVNAKINDDGTLTIVDFFMPWEKTQLDGADKDLGSSPLEILPSDVFSCPNHRRIGVVTGKSGKTYWLDLDNMGGYQNGPNKLDAIIGTFQNENSVYAGAAVLPLGGGYVYISVTQYQTHVFKFSCDMSGKALFTKVSDSPDKNANILGTGHGTTTSLNGQEGTGLLWVSDVQGSNLRIYDPIPPSSGPLKLLNSFVIPGVTKFTRPVFGNGRAYIGTTQGYLYGFGSPANLPLNCSSPYTFGSVEVGNASAPVTVGCIALTATSVTLVEVSGTKDFNISNVPTLPMSLKAEQSFTFSAIFSPSHVGSLSTDVTIHAVSATPGYSSSVPVVLKGTGDSMKPILAIVPNINSFNIIFGQPSPTQSSLLWNLGNSLLTFTNISFSLTSEQGPWVTPNSTDDGNLQVGQFEFLSVRTTIQPKSSEPISITYKPNAPGNHAVYIRGFSDGGTAVLDVFGAAGTYPKAVIGFQTIDGSAWVSYSNTTPFNFGTVYEAQSRSLQMRITNGGGPNAVPLSVTVSKPPYGIPGIIGAANNIDLAEGTIILANQSQTAVLYCAVPKSQVNLPFYNGSAVWVLNTGDPNLGKQEVGFFCQAAAEQVGPLFPNGTARYGYVGCFKENNPGRQLGTNVYSDTANNTNDRCIAACFQQGYVFAGTQYSQECWCGQALPVQRDNERDCNFGCTGNRNQICGGDGHLHDTAHISLFADLTKFNGNTTSPPLQITPSVGAYNFIGCFAESAGRALGDNSTTSNVMTVEVCAAFCSAYTYFGLEFSAECYCGAKLNPAATITNSSQCNMPCKGSNSEFCGAGNRMQIYQVNGVSPISSSSSTSSTLPNISISSTTSNMPNSSLSTPSTSVSPGSFPLTSTTSDSVPTSSATGPVVVPSAGEYNYIGCYNEISGGAFSAKSIAISTMTVKVCATYCSGYMYFGVENGQECYCGNAIPVMSLPVTDNQCNIPCADHVLEICGGSNRLGVYQLASTPLPATTALNVTTSPPPSSSFSTPTSSLFSLPLSGIQTVGSYIYQGCWTEGPNGVRALSGIPALVNTTSMTPSLCAQYCYQFSYFGLEYSQECFCGPYPSVNSTRAPKDSDCNMRCTGDKSLLCGAGNRLSLYKSNDPSKVSTDPGIPANGGVGNYSYQACMRDLANPRLLPVLLASDDMSVEACLAVAEAGRYAYAGLEFGRECWLGNVLQGMGTVGSSGGSDGTNGVAVSEAECRQSCLGARGELCGGPSRLNLWVRNPVGELPNIKVHVGDKDDS
ncbi:WSC-domain-containing protein [Lindgomyces ingoldianus]|uniref:WSC-domain-containing protein n=1 Tax=Lindgomyces ingoldianus TaxID=673940 RepID=A0ACB6RG52_9PLEO|nr:WSC-domain-containing protein [Lindgomyces ingoldianus]KAF2478258.1 WSC-domain-containing protein [Lindgomyces ingoldianus]